MDMQWRRDGLPEPFDMLRRKGICAGLAVTWIKSRREQQRDSAINWDEQKMYDHIWYIREFNEAPRDLRTAVASFTGFSTTLDSSGEEAGSEDMMNSVLNGTHILVYMYDRLPKKGTQNYEGHAFGIEIQGDQATIFDPARGTWQVETARLRTTFFGILNNRCEGYFGRLDGMWRVMHVN